MKKTLVALLAVSLLLAAVGCGQTGKPAQTAAPSAVEKNSETTSSALESKQASKPEAKPETTPAAESPDLKSVALKELEVLPEVSKVSFPDESGSPYLEAMSAFEDKLLLTMGTLPANAAGGAGLSNGLYRYETFGKKLTQLVDLKPLKLRVWSAQQSGKDVYFTASKADGSYALYLLSGSDSKEPKEIKALGREYNFGLPPTVMNTSWGTYLVDAETAGAGNAGELTISTIYGTEIKPIYKEAFGPESRLGSFSFRVRATAYGLSFVTYKSEKQETELHLIGKDKPQTVTIPGEFVEAICNGNKVLLLSPVTNHKDGSNTQKLVAYDLASKKLSAPLEASPVDFAVLSNGLICTEQKDKDGNCSVSMLSLQGDAPTFVKDLGKLAGQGLALSNGVDYVFFVCPTYGEKESTFRFYEVAKFN